MTTGDPPNRVCNVHGEYHPRHSNCPKCAADQPILKRESKALANDILADPNSSPAAITLANAVLEGIKRDEECAERPDGDGWEPWVVGALLPPCRETARVDVKFRNGIVDTDRIAGTWSWRHKDQPRDILWWRRAV